MKGQMEAYHIVWFISKLVKKIGQQMSVSENWQMSEVLLEEKKKPLRKRIRKTNIMLGVIER